MNTRASLGFVLCLALLILIPQLPEVGRNAVGQDKSGEWKKVDIPAAWKASRSLSAISNRGFGWYRAQVEVPRDWQDQDLEIFVESIDDARQVYFNGVLVGTAGSFPPDFRSGLGTVGRYKVLSKHVRQKNTVAIRVFRDDGRGGFNVAAPVLFAAKQGIRMQGGWQFRQGDDRRWALDREIPKEFRFAKVESRSQLEATLRKLAGEMGPQSVANAVKMFEVHNDLRWEPVLTDPDIAQPLSFKFDGRGRLWVVEYLQYPNPAGLKMVSRDKYLRAVYDKTPPAPPNHFRGADRITIHEDTNGDGLYDKHKTFVNGLSIVSSFAIGRGGVWVMNPPYLLFYPDSNGDDVPDGNPEVLLEGFGIEDSHSVANSLRWGPDGWLYAAQGSTVTGHIKRPGTKDKPVHSLGQLIWRYHPVTRRYEVFAEGGGNAFGVEIDSHGRIYSGYNGGNARGFHYVQGGYYRKGFQKHGELSNPYAYGYFPSMKHNQVPRFTHTFVIYEADQLPQSYVGKLFGVEPLQGRVVYSDVTKDGSSLQTKDLGHPVKSKDSWFRPVDIQLGPDGALYVADLYEQRIDHASHYQGRVDKTNGRIYRLTGTKSPAARKVDLRSASTAELIETLKHPNRWHRQTALRFIGDRRDKKLIGPMKKRLVQADGLFALNLLWAINLSGGLDEATTAAALNHEDPHVRAWAVRLACDDAQVSPQLASQLIAICETELNVEVRSQLACSARRLKSQLALQMVRNLFRHSQDADDVHMPLLLWWAVEHHVSLDLDGVIRLFDNAAVWRQRVVQEHLLERLMRRLASSGTQRELLACARLLQLAPSKDLSGKMMKGFELAFAGRSLTALPDELVAAIAKTGGASLGLRLRQSEPKAIEEAARLIGDAKQKAANRIQYIEIFGQIDHQPIVAELVDILQRDTNTAVRSAALGALQSYRSEQIDRVVLKMYKSLNGDVRAVADTLLASRPERSLSLLRQVDSGAVPKDLVKLTVVRRMLLHDDPAIKKLVDKHWGVVQGATTEQMKSQLERVSRVMRAAGTGNPYKGKKLYAATCGKCHRLFDHGGDIGPNLTAFKRDDLPNMMLNIINPSIEIRKGYENYVIRTEDGRTLNGFIADQDNRVIVLRGVDNQSVVIPKDNVDQMRAISQSIMPEGILDKLSPQEIRDLFAYLRATQPLP